MPRSLITGANGHVGAHLVRELQQRDHEVVAFVRETSDLRGLAGLDVETRHGDIRDADSLIRAAKGCDLIFATAAVYRSWAKNPAEIMEPALKGAKNVFEAAAANGVGKIVFTSSIAAIGTSARPDAQRTEKDWNQDPVNVYMRAKTESERRVYELAEIHQVPVVVVCPSMVWGSLDYRITPSMLFLKNWLNGIGTTWTGGVNFVRAADVALVHALAAEKGEPGKRYLACGENVYIPEARKLLHQLTGVKPIHAYGRAPNLMGAAFFELAAKMTGGEPFVSLSWAKEGAGRYQYYDGSWSQQQLGYTPMGFQDVLRESISWMLHIGVLRPGVAQRITTLFPADPAWPPG